MTGKPLKVMIVGAGTGGLCLAQGLKLNNVSVELFERDYSPTDRLQGYRLSIDTAGGKALPELLAWTTLRKSRRQLGQTEPKGRLSRSSNEPPARN
jgi:2-polyprenyl-6-methoxyphenol hydroxylase-like FAD-dependent oxidoreductase